MSSTLQALLREWFDSPDMAIYAAINDNDTPALQHLLQASPAPDLDRQISQWGGPIHVAALRGNIAAVDALLQAGADSLAVSKGDYRLPPMSIAIKEGHLDVARRLWHHSPPASHVDYKYPHWNGLATAAYYGEASYVGELLEAWGGWPQDVKEEALIRACYKWRVYAADQLLAKIAYSQEVLNKALEHAVGYKLEFPNEPLVRHYEGFEFMHQQHLIARLVDAGADPNMRVCNEPLLFLPARSANLVGALKVLLEKGADPNAADDQGQSALCLVASPVQVSSSTTMFNETAIRLLLQHGANVCQRSKAGDTPLHWAVRGSNQRVFRLFFSAWQDPNYTHGMRDDHGQSLLHYAAAGCKLDILEYLLSQGMDVNEQSSNGWSPLMCTLTPVRNGMSGLRDPSDAARAARLLLDHGADPTVKTHESWTPLHCLALHHGLDDSEEIFQLARDFISRGADVEARAPFLVDASSPNCPVSFFIPWGHRLQEAMQSAAAASHPAPPIHDLAPGQSARPRQTPAGRYAIKADLTPLYWAAERGSVGVVKALVEHGAKQSPTHPADVTPARAAAESRYMERRPEIMMKIIDILLAAGGGF